MTELSPDRRGGGDDGDEVRWRQGSEDDDGVFEAGISTSRSPETSEK